MPSGKPDVRRVQRGMTYLLLLFVLAAAGAGMAALGEQWALAAQREREAELLFRGRQFSQALADWRDLSPAGQPRAPLSLRALLVDERLRPPRHHLRQIYVDPFSGQADWDLVLDAEGRIQGLASRSRRPALRRVRVVLREGADSSQPAVGDWVFMTSAAASAAPAASAVSAAARPVRRP